MELVITILEVGVKMACNNLLSMRELHSKYIKPVRDLRTPHLDKP
jgi:hypothetical protein